MWPRLRLRLNLGLVCALLVLLPALVAAELVVRAYERRAVEDVRSRSNAGLDALSGLFDQERTRTLNNAEVAAERLGPLVKAEAPADDLVKAAADTRSTYLRTTSLVALVDAGGHTLASDPASNLPFGTQGDVKTALQGKLAAGWQERGVLALEATAPLRVDGPQPGAALVAVNIDDGFLNTGSKLTGLEMGIVTTQPNQPARIVAASRALRRAISFTGDSTADIDLVGKPGDAFKRGVVGADGFFLAARGIALSNGREIGTMLVGVPVEPIDDAVRQVRLLVFGASALGALGAGVAGALVSRRTADTVRSLASGIERLEQARGRADQLQAVLASLTEGVIVANAERRVVLVNPAARGLLSLPARGDEQALGLLTDELLPASERVIRSYSAPVRGESGQILGTVTVLRDATRDQELDRLKSEFLTVVSHELQTPLTAIKGALELVMDDDTGQLSRVQRRFLETIDRNSVRLVGLVGDLLDLSRLEAGRVELDPQPLDTPTLVRGALAAVSNLFEARGTHLLLDVPESVPPILGDRRRVEQILTNLLANAAKYTPAGGVVEVAASSANGHVALSVADNGPGVPEAERDIVFDKFYRGRHAQQRGDAGSGLGLAIVKSLVDLHGGSVRVEDSVPRGARFVVELPRATEEEED
ncbi:MAG: PAS domain-containing sensor histidine kinase [Chloroflexota bacterium]|nr:PAS domain-containing sensor histidine kinase [Chloroflexota bacterium]